MDELSIKRGDDETISLVFTDEGTGLPTNLTNCTVWFTARKRAAATAVKDDTDAPIHKKVENITAVNGVVDINLSGTETDIALGDYLAEAQLKDANGKYTSSEVFKLIVEEDITRSR